jgi:hypothetical protein
MTSLHMFLQQVLALDADILSLTPLRLPAL